MSDQASVIVDATKKALITKIALTSVIALSGAFIWLASPLVESVTAIVNSPKTIVDLSNEIKASREESRQDSQAIKKQINELASAVAQATGEDRVIRMQPGLSYVTEPVKSGEIVTLNLVVQRTKLGATCRLVSRTGLFTDVTGVAIGGESLKPARQIGVESSRIRVDLHPPKNLMPGRIEVYLALEFDCGGRSVFDRTDTLVYTLLAP